MNKRDTERVIRKARDVCAAEADIARAFLARPKQDIGAPSVRLHAAVGELQLALEKADGLWKKRNPKRTR